MCGLKALLGGGIWDNSCIHCTFQSLQHVLTISNNMQVGEATAHWSDGED